MALDIENRNKVHPYWSTDVPLELRRKFLDSLYPDKDVWRRFTDLESSGEFEEVRIFYTFLITIYANNFLMII